MKKVIVTILVLLFPVTLWATDSYYLRMSEVGTNRLDFGAFLEVEVADEADARIQETFYAADSDFFGGLTYIASYHIHRPGNPYEHNCTMIPLRHSDMTSYLWMIEETDWTKVPTEFRFAVVDKQTADKLEKKIKDKFPGKVWKIKKQY